MPEEERQDFSTAKILSQRAWIIVQFLDLIGQDEQEKQELVNSAAQMLSDAIELGSGSQASIRLATLVHLHRDRLNEEFKETNEQKLWLTALKEDKENAHLFYCIGMFTYLHKQDPKKGKACLEKALLLKPDLHAAQEFLTMILVKEGQFQAALELVERIQKH